MLKNRTQMAEILCRSLLIGVVFISNTAWAHDPIFGDGPHVLFKGGFEVSPEFHVSKNGDEKETEFGLELKYGNFSSSYDMAGFPFARE